MPELIIKIKSGIYLYKKFLYTKIGNLFLALGIKLSPEYFNTRVMETAVIASKRFIRDEMKRQGIMKCEIEGCLKRAPLRYFQESLVCAGHWDILNSRARTKEPSAVLTAKGG